MDVDRFERVEVASEGGLWAWFEKHHAQPESVWLVTFKAADRARYVSKDQVLDALIAFGWIDGRRLKLDDARTMQLISPRKQQAWAASYKARADRLERAGRMRPAGRAAIEAGKASGLWNSSDPVDALTVPEDLAKALKGPARASLDAFAPSYRRNLLRWIASAKTAPTRAKRIAAATESAQTGEKIRNL
ncbi:MAG: YdeI/OmpD-associated family protein [Pseudomonadota bacterium]